MNVIKIPNTETKGDILKRITECISNKDVFISKDVVSKLFVESHMEYEGNGTYCIVQLTWHDDSEKGIKFHTHSNGHYIVDWVFINNQFKSCDAMFGITDERIFFEMD